MKTKTNLKAAGFRYNHNQTLKTKTNLKAAGARHNLSQTTR